MTRVEALQNKLEKKVFEQLGSSASIYTLDTASVDKWGDESNVYDAAVVITIAPYNLTYSQRLQDAWGNLNAHETDFIVKHDQVFDKNAIFLYDSIYWKVMLIEKYPLNSDSAAFRVRLTKHPKQSVPATS